MWRICRSLDTVLTRAKSRLLSYRDWGWRRISSCRAGRFVVSVENPEPPHRPCATSSAVQRGRARGIVTAPGNKMLLTITTTHRPATDLGFLLHKNPARVQSFDLSFGPAHVFYPDATSERCTAALLLEVDPSVWCGTARPCWRRLFLGALRQRPALRRLFVPERGDRAVFGSAPAGSCKERPELAETPCR